jgi:cytochrome o ubiquinol oxidase operon protein cyoD
MHHDAHQPDYGTGKKSLGVYLTGLIICIILTLIAFWVVIDQQFSKNIILITIFSAACLQLLVQIICFLRLNTETEQSKINVMSLIFTGVILLVIVSGSLWIMWSTNYYMMIM